MNTPLSRHALLASLVATAALQANADTVTDWNLRANSLVAGSPLGTPPAIRVMAIVQTAVHQALDGLPPRLATAKPAIDAAVAVANQATLTQLLPDQRTKIDAAVQAALAGIADGPAKAVGMATGERAAAVVLAARAGDGAGGAESYRPHATAGVYVPTALPAVPQWVSRFIRKFSENLSRKMLRLSRRTLLMRRRCSRGSSIAWSRIDRQRGASVITHPPRGWIG